MRKEFFLFCFFLAIPSAVMAATSARAVSGNEIALQDGRTLRLEGIEQPFADTADLRHEAQKHLQDLISDRPIAFGENSTIDRYGRLTAQAYAVDNNGKKIWLQNEMLNHGYAFIYPPTGDETLLDEMLSAEMKARKTQSGIWADEAYADRPADNIWKEEGSFAFVSGTMLDAVRIKNKAYLNFGPDWHKDFTISIAARDLRKFRKAGIDPLELKGKTIRVRGWVKREFGPMVTATNPTQIEILAQP